MRSKIKWSFIVFHLVQMLLTISALVSFRKFYAIDMETIGSQSYHLRNMLKSITLRTFYQFVMGGTLFYLFWHCWLNLWAELVMFGDRYYYGKWWTSVDTKQWLREWNIIVQDWIYFYLYKPILRVTHNNSFTIFVVIFMSTLVHEMIASFMLRFYLPVFIIVFGIITSIFVIFGKTVHLLPHGFENIGYIIALLMGPVVFFTIYTLEWYARNNGFCPKKLDSLTDFFWPRILSCIQL
ncbi:sterol O-acyltransferase 2-like [Oppia nitens]|uniref:sterol O-acyltransferase 2-like n=1 Tax=Oppia nitens TaxID=1686743 RepID=UPI0023DCD471|nr:sterol O-acyltransferase 2-like [Oppia nitens]